MQPVKVGLEYAMSSRPPVKRVLAWSWVVWSDYMELHPLYALIQVLVQLMWFSPISEWTVSAVAFATLLGVRLLLWKNGAADFIVFCNGSNALAGGVFPSSWSQIKLLFYHVTRSNNSLNGASYFEWSLNPWSGLAVSVLLPNWFSQIFNIARQASSPLHASSLF